MQTNNMRIGDVGRGELIANEDCAYIGNLINHKGGTFLPMNRILFELQQDNYSLDPRDPRFEHVRGVLRMRERDSFDVGVINGPTGKATITGLDRTAMSIRVEWGTAPPPPPPVHLLVGMCRPATARKILVTAPTLGVREMHFVTTARSDPAYARSGLWKDGEWRTRVIEGVGQAFDTYVPPVHVHGDLGQAISRLPSNCLKLALDVYEGRTSMGAIAVPDEIPACLAIGPERGWDARDRDLLRGAGFELVSLNDRVLRVETAVTVGLTLLLQRMGVY
jgi:RsmE family RNA methyltransferase